MIYHLFRVQLSGFAFLFMLKYKFSHKVNMARITKAALYKWAAGKSSLSVNRIFCSHGIFKTTADSHFLRPTSSAPTMGQGTHCNALHQPHHHIHITSTTKQKQESSHRANLFHFIEVQCTPYPPPKPTSSNYISY